MAARLTKRQAAGARDAISTGLLIKSLQDHVLSDKELSQSRIAAANILLKKTLPDLKVTEVTGADGGPIEFKALPFAFESPEEA